MKLTRNTPCRLFLSPKEYYILKYNVAQGPRDQEWGGSFRVNALKKIACWLPSPWARKLPLLNATRIECWASSERVQSLKPLSTVTFKVKGKLFNAKQCSETFQTIRFVGFWTEIRPVNQVISAAWRSTAGAGRRAFRFQGDIYVFPSGFKAPWSPCCPSLIPVLLKLLTIPTMIH